MHNRRTYRYETHLHTYPVSKCAHKGVREALLFYKVLGYDGVFITNHFIDGNINMDRSSLRDDSNQPYGLVPYRRQAAYSIQGFALIYLRSVQTY